MKHDSQPEAYYIHVWIREIHPMLWRRFLVRSDGTLADLHAVLQIGFDWTDFHLHRFRIHFRINECFLYEYDFGDLWQHQVRIEKRLGVETSRSYPLCVGGQWAGPPDWGSVSAGRRIGVWNRQRKTLADGSGGSLWLPEWRCSYETSKTSWPMNRRAPRHR